MPLYPFLGEGSPTKKVGTLNLTSPLKTWINSQKHAYAKPTDGGKIHFAALRSHGFPVIPLGFLRRVFLLPNPTNLVAGKSRGNGPKTTLNIRLLKVFICFPVLVLKGFFSLLDIFLSSGLNQMEANRRFFLWTCSASAKNCLRIMVYFASALSSGKISKQSSFVSRLSMG